MYALNLDNDEYEPENEQEELDLELMRQPTIDSEEPEDDAQEEDAPDEPEEPEIPQKQCNTCAVSFPKTRENFAALGLSCKTGQPYFSSTCRRCAARKNAAKYVPVPRDQQRPRGRAVVLSDAKRARLYKLLYEQNLSCARAAALTGVKVSTLRRWKKEGKLVAPSSVPTDTRPPTATH